MCLTRIPAVLRQENGIWKMHKECPTHGRFSVVVWRGTPERQEWTGHRPELPAQAVANCPDACGICVEHQQSTCCVLLEITSRCNLSCSFCFAEAGECSTTPDPSADMVRQWIADIANKGNAFLQLSGGEPTMRSDLPELVRYAKERGCAYVQLNSNGLRLAQDESLVHELAEAGLSFVFLQFDGLDDTIYRSLRGKPLLEQKLQAIQNCGKYNIGVTLVPTVVPGVNDRDIGNIVRFAVKNSPVVRGVHLQPISHFRRPAENDPPVSDEQRITLPEVYRALFEQAGGIIPENSIVQSRCDHPACGFHGGYIVTPEGLRALSSPEQTPCCAIENAAERNRHFVGSRWQRPAASCCASPDTNCASPDKNDVPEDRCDLNSLDGFLQRAKSHAFTISAMAFQDPWNLDLERLRHCSLHVYDQGRVVPFCSRYIF